MDDALRIKDYRDGIARSAYLDDGRRNDLSTRWKHWRKTVIDESKRERIHSQTFATE
jgi:hypothetical protein